MAPVGDMFDPIGAWHPGLLVMVRSGATFDRIKPCPTGRWKWSILEPRATRSGPDRVSIKMRGRIWGDHVAPPKLAMANPFSQLFDLKERTCAAGP